MEVMRRFIIDLKPDGTMKWAEVCDEPNVEYRAYKRIADYCKTMMRLNVDRNLDMYIAYKNVFELCKKEGQFW